MRGWRLVVFVLAVLLNLMVANMNFATGHPWNGILAAVSAGLFAFTIIIASARP